MNEIWKPVVGYEGFYEVSNLGNVRSVNRIAKRNYRGDYFRKSQPIIQSSIDGYKCVILSKFAERHTLKVHRLVAMAFIPNPNNYPCINHKDEVRDNNFVFVNQDGSVDADKSNLEWCTPKYNNNYGSYRRKMSEIKTNDPSVSKKVAQITKNGDIINIFPSTSEAGRILGINNRNIASVCRGERNIAGGYKWKFIENI